MPVQRGNTLIMALVMLTVMTLMAVSAIKLSTTNVQVVGNVQFQEEAAAVAQQAIENVISTNNFMITAPVPQRFDINSDGVDDYTVTFAPPPSCRWYQAVNAAVDPAAPEECSTSLSTTLCYWTHWDITAVATDALTGAEITVVQGVRSIAGLKSYLALCGP